MHVCVTVTDDLQMAHRAKDSTYGRRKAVDSDDIFRNILRNNNL